MHPDDLKTMWLCCECNQNFVFHSDVEDHRKEYNHPRVILCNLSKDKRSPVIFMRGRVSIPFRVSGKKSTVVIEYQYYISTGEIDYFDVRFSDRDLQTRVENDYQLMENIDNYLRKVLDQQAAGIRKKVPPLQ